MEIGVTVSWSWCASLPENKSRSQISYMCGMEHSEWTGLSSYLIWGWALHDETKNAWLHRKLTEEAFPKNIKFLLWNLRNKWYSAKQKFCKEASFDDNTTGLRPQILEVSRALVLFYTATEHLKKRELHCTCKILLWQFLVTL